MVKTLRDRFIEALVAKGEKPDLNARTTKYVVYTRHIDGVQKGFYYIGKNGSLRVGMNATSSIPVSSKFKAQLLGIEGTI